MKTLVMAQGKDTLKLYYTYVDSKEKDIIFVTPEPVNIIYTKKNIPDEVYFICNFFLQNKIYELNYHGGYGSSPIAELEQIIDGVIASYKN